MKIFVLNSGSSSIRFCVMDVSQTYPMKSQTTCQTMIRGKLQGIRKGASLEIHEGGKRIFHSRSNMDNHEEAFTWMFDSLQSLQKSGDMQFDSNAIEAVGHRVVHGGDDFSDSIVIDASVLQKIVKLNDLAPLHNPACLEGISKAQTWLGNSLPMVAVFDTAFHNTLPAYAATYPIPYDLSERHHIRRYGFHGIAHASLSANYALHTGKALSEQRLITLHLGNGCSITAIRHGKSIDTSMGFTPSEGLMMGTRSGDLDPSIIRYLSKKEQVPMQRVVSWLNEHSGLLGVSGRTNDMRQILHAATHEQDSRAQLAIEMFCYRIRKYLGAYLAVLEGTNAIVFGGGIGENSPEIRAQICQSMDWCGVKLDTDRNQGAVELAPGSTTEISQSDSAIPIYVTGTDEESWIASEAARCLSKQFQEKG